MHVTLPDGVRLATLTAGMAFGEMALIETTAPPTCSPTCRATAFEVPLKGFERFRKQHPHASERIMRNLAQLLADRLIVAKRRVDLLTALDRAAIALATQHRLTAGLALQLDASRSGISAALVMTPGSQCRLMQPCLSPPLRPAACRSQMSPGTSTS